MPLNSPKRPPYWNSTSGFHFHTSPQSPCHYVLVCEILSKWDHPRQKKWRHVDFQDGVSQPSWVVGIQYWVLWKAQLSLHNFLEVVNEHHSSKLSSFWENRVFCILATDRQTDRQTNGQTDEQLRCVKPQSRYRELRLKKSISNGQNKILSNMQLIVDGAKSWANQRRRCRPLLAANQIFLYSGLDNQQACTHNTTQW